MGARNEWGDWLIGKKPDRDFVDFPVGKRALQNKWVYKLKEEEGGKKWHKARLVGNGFTQKKVYILMKYFLLLLKSIQLRLFQV